MRDQLILLPGWGLGVSPLEPLAAALRGLDEHLHVSVEPLPVLASTDPADWLGELDATLPDDVWLGGWSLGGMLASQLAARRGERCCGLVTLASNLSFVEKADWPWGMAAASFDGFLDGCHADPKNTLKRFSLLCAQGAADARGLARLLAAGAPLVGAGFIAGLEVLAELDGRDALSTFRGPQLHLFAGLDGLVPAEAAEALLGVLPDVEVGVIEHGSHAFLLEDPHGVAGAIYAFLHEADDD